MGKFKDIDLSIKTIKLFPDLKKKLKKGTISTIDSPAKKFVDIRTRIKKAGGYAMGGQASESVARSKIIKDQRKRQQDKLNQMLERLYGKDEIKPKKKPKKPGNLRFSIPEKQKPGNLKTLKSKPKKPGNLRFSK